MFIVLLEDCVLRVLKPQQRTVSNKLPGREFRLLTGLNYFGMQLDGLVPAKAGGKSMHDAFVWSTLHGLLYGNSMMDRSLMKSPRTGLVPKELLRGV